MPIIRQSSNLIAVIKYALLHAVVTMAVWFGPLTYAAFGLGFKDKEKWSLLDHFISATALPVADVLTMPGRYMTWDGDGGFVVPALFTSFSWGVVITAVVGISKRVFKRRVSK